MISFVSNLFLVITAACKPPVDESTARQPLALARSQEEPLLELVEKVKGLLPHLKQVVSQGRSDCWFETYAARIQPRLQMRARNNSFLVAPFRLKDVMGEEAFQDLYLYALTDFVSTQAEQHMEQLKQSRWAPSQTSEEIRQRLKYVIAEVDYWATPLRK